MKLIWTYNTNVNFGDQVGLHTPKRQLILLNYYIHSIKTAAGFGYYTIIYCDDAVSEYFNDIANEVIVVDSYENSPLWDSFKIKVLEDRTDDFALIDGDVILHNKLPLFTTDVTFDSYEINNFKFNYKEILNDLTNMGIGKVLSVWVNKQLPIISCGILSIKNKHLKENYISNWKLYNKFIIEHIDKVDIDFATMVGAQYLLSILAEDTSQTKLSNFVGGDNEYYKHYCGPLKYKTPVVAVDYSIHNIKKILF
jgi:hypothetical protein